MDVFLALVLLQGFHLFEHVVQVAQIHLLGVADGRGILGSVVDLEPLHLAYNTVYLGLALAVYLLLDLDVDGPGRHGRLVFGLLTFAVAFEAWHELEHVFKVEQFFALGRNGTGGIFGQGTGGLVPLFPLPLLHLAYNAVAYAPALAAYIVLRQRSPIRGHPRIEAST